MPGKRPRISAEQPPQVYDEVDFPVHSLSGQVLLTTAKASWRMQDMHQSLLTSLGCSHSEMYDVCLSVGERHLFDKDIVSEVALAPGEIVQAVMRISFDKYFWKVRAAIRRIPCILGVRGHDESVLQNFDLEALLMLVCKAKDLQRRPPVLGRYEGHHHTLTHRTISVSLAHYIHNIWGKTVAHEKLVEYAPALEVLEQWEPLFKDLSASVRFSSLIAHQQLAPRIVTWFVERDWLHVLLEIGRSDPESCVQQAAWDNLAAILPLMEVNPLVAMNFLRYLESERHESRISVFEACLRSEAPSTRIAALAALRRLESVRYHDTFYAMSRSDIEPIVRKAAERACRGQWTASCM